MESMGLWLQMQYPQVLPHIAKRLVVQSVSAGLTHFSNNSGLTHGDGTEIKLPAGGLS